MKILRPTIVSVMCNPIEKKNPQSFPTLPYCYPNIQFPEIIHFQYFDVEKKNRYSTYRTDVGENSTLFQIRMKPYAKLQTQRPTKVPIQKREN